MATWRATVGTTQYSIVINDRFVRLAKSDGTPETFGGNNVPAQRFLRSERLKQHVRDVFGESVLVDVLAAAEIAAGLPVAPRKA